MRFNADSFKFTEKETNRIFISLAEFSKDCLRDGSLSEKSSLMLYNEFCSLSENLWFAERCRSNAEIAAFLLQTIENVKEQPLYLIPNREYDIILSLKACPN